MLSQETQQNYFKNLITNNTKYINTNLKASWLETPLGPMLTIADDNFLYLLEFVHRRNLEQEIKRLQQHMRSQIIFGTNAPIKSIETELSAYFAGTLKTFKTPYCLLGTDFQKSVWHALTTVAYGQTKSYATQASMLGKPSAYRAVANANGTNQLAIIVPCHRIITSAGALGGYGAGVMHKQWLIEHERKYNNELRI